METTALTLWQTLRTRAPLYIRLMRLDRPIGTWLLLWPTLWALFLATAGHPSAKVLLAFMLGTLLMRTAGCVVNDMADKDFDAHVARTQGRPLATGELSRHQALPILLGLLLLAASLLLLLNKITFYWAFGALALALTYPFMKRWTYLPQVVLGAAFSWAIPMAYAAQDIAVDRSAWLLYASALAWVVAYDTQYAMVDREDDIRIGVKSTAILFGDLDLLMIGVLQGLFLLGLDLLAPQQHLGLPFRAALLLALILFARQMWRMRSRQREDCFDAFLNNHWVGAVIFAGLFFDYLGH